MNLKLYKVLCFVLVYLYAGQSTADPFKADSLKKAIALLPATFKGDTMKVSMLIQLAREVSADSQSISILNEAMLLSQKRKWEKGIMMVTCRTGFHYGRMGLDYRACEFLFKGLRLAEMRGDNAWIGFAYRYLGDNHSDMGQYRKGIQFQFKAIPYLLKGGDYLRYLTSIHNIALDYIILGNYDGAITYLKLCLKKNSSYRQKDIDGLCLTNLAVAYEKKGNLDSALLFLDKYRKTVVSIPDDLAGADIESARIYFRKGDLQTALHFATTALQRQGKQRKNTDKEVHEMLYLIYQQQQNYKEAFANLLKLTEVQSLNKQDMQQKQVESLRFYYENEKQKADIEILNSDLRRKNLERTIYIFGLWAGGIFISLLSFVIYWINKNRRKIETQRNEISKIKEELDLSNQQLTALNSNLEERVKERTNDLVMANEELTAKNREIKEAFFNGQTNERKRVASELHDNLGGTISALKWQFESMETEGLNTHEKMIYDNVLSMMEVAYADVRNISHNLMPRELENGGLSIALQNLLSDLTESRRINFRFQSNYTPGFLGKHKEVELYGVCLELINNILKHARASQASLELTQMKDNVVLIISDNGVGIPQLQSNKKNGIGLQNLKNRIASINGRIEISEVHPSGTMFRITIYFQEVLEKADRTL